MPSAVHHRWLLRFSTGPGGCFQEGIPCIEERSLYSNGDGIKQISTTFQQLRETGSEGEKKKVASFVTLSIIPSKGHWFLRSANQGVYKDKNVWLLSWLTDTYWLFTLTARAALLPWLWYHHSEASACGAAPQPVRPALKEELITCVLPQVTLSCTWQVLLSSLLTYAWPPNK